VPNTNFVNGLAYGQDADTQFAFAEALPVAKRIWVDETDGMHGTFNIIWLSIKLKCPFMSGYTADIVAEHGVLEFGVHFFQKPFSAEDIAMKIREVLDGVVGGSA
jgi:hypothetical protein